jgi:hypothetical protein
MMPGTDWLKFVQLGQEVTSGTPVAASTIWRGGWGGLVDKRPPTVPEEKIGIIGGEASRQYSPKIWSELVLPEGEATFEQLPHILEAGVEKETPTQDGTGSGYVYQYNVPVTAQNTIRTYTIETGDDQQAEEADYCFVRQLDLTGTAEEALKMSAQWTGREVTNTTKTPALTVPSVEDILFSNATLYLDNSGGTVGTTQVSDTLWKMALSHKTGLEAYWRVNGSKEFAFLKMGDEDIMLTLTYEHDGNAVAEKAHYRTDPKTVRLMRLEIPGSNLATPGTYSTKLFRMDMAGYYEDWGELGEQNGNSIVECKFRIKYVSADALKMVYLIVNELSALP